MDKKMDMKFEELSITIKEVVGQRFSLLDKTKLQPTVKPRGNKGS